MVSYIILVTSTGCHTFNCTVQKICTQLLDMCCLLLIETVLHKQTSSVFIRNALTLLELPQPCQNSILIFCFVLSHSNIYCRLMFIPLILSELVMQSLMVRERKSIRLVTSHVNSSSNVDTSVKASAAIGMYMYTLIIINHLDPLWSGLYYE